MQINIIFKRFNYLFLICAPALVCVLLGEIIFQTKGEPKWKQSLYSSTRLSRLTSESRNNDEISGREKSLLSVRKRW